MVWSISDAILEPKGRNGQIPKMRKTLKIDLYYFKQAERMHMLMFCLPEIGRISEIFEIIKQITFRTYSF